MTDAKDVHVRLLAFGTRAARVGATVGVVLFVAVIAWLIHRASIGVVSIPGEKALASSGGPPWILGQPRARFTLVTYADLTCPYCRQYLPTLRQLIAEHPEVNLQWHHLPLPEHEPAARQTARLAECAGEVSGGSGFWAAVDWLYRHPHHTDSTLPDSFSSSRMTSRVQACLRSARPDAIISRDITQANQDQVSATPTLRVLDRENGRSLMLQGILEPDALLSALDLLASSASESDPE